MERRAAARLPDLTSARDRRSAERIRARFRRQARVFAFMLGLLPRERVDATPIDARGHDPEIAEFILFDERELAVAIRSSLAQACGP